MITINYTWVCGLVFGLESDMIACYDEDADEMEERPIWYLHLGIITLFMIF